MEERERRDKMRLCEQIKTDLERYRRLKSGGEKAAFVWDYYKYPIIAAGVFLIILILVLLNNIGRDKIAMYMVMVNSDAAYVECDDSGIQRLLSDSDFDTDGRKIDINTSYTIGTRGSSSSDMETIQVLTALFSISDLDVYVADRDWFDYFAKEGGYADLSLLIDKNLLSEHEDLLYYTEDSNGNRTLSGMIIPENSVFRKAGYYHDDAILGVVARGENLEAAVAFVDSFLRNIN